MSQVFSFQDHPVRTIIENDQPWFSGSDIAKLLGYVRPEKEVRRICKNVKLFKPTKLVGWGNSPRGFLIIPESDVWRLIVHSTLPKAQEIEEWIMSEVLPAIRKTGKYEAKPKRERKALGSGIPALPCQPPVLEPDVYLRGRRLFDLMNKLMRDFDLVKTHVTLWGRPGGRLARLSPEKESLYQNAVDASKMALCGLNQAQFALRIAMQIQAAHSFDGR